MTRIDFSKIIAVVPRSRVADVMAAEGSADFCGADLAESGEAMRTAAEAG